MRPLRYWLLCLLALTLVTTAQGQEKVTIPKSRLEELERKEAELERVKSGATPAAPVIAPAASPAPASTANALAPVPSEPTSSSASVPAPASLPPLQPGERVSSKDLVSQFLADPVHAEKRYRKQVIVVEGKVVRISKPLMRRDYELVLEGPQAGQEVVCRLRAPDGYDAIYTVNHGAELVATSREQRTTLARTGATTAIRGRCKGLKGAQVSFVEEPETR